MIKKNSTIKGLFTGIFIIVSLMLSSCEKFLTHDDPQGVTDEQWWNTEADAYGAINSVYAGIPDGSHGRNVMYLSGLSDEAVHRGDFKGDYDSFTRGLHSSRWGVAQNIWQDDYIDIRRANRFLENVDRVFMDEELKTRMKYEARALRAYYHMELMLFFGDIPLVTTSIKPNENELARNPQEDVYNFIVAELTEAGNNLPKEYDNTDNWRITSGICWALISRLGLYYHDYQQTIEASQKIIESGVYELYISDDQPENSYSELFGYAGELNDERIFFSVDGCSNAWRTFAPFGIGGETYLSPTNTVVNNYETLQGKTIQALGGDSLDIYQKHPNYNNNRDPRLYASIFYPGENFNDEYILDPFNNPSDRIGPPKSTSTGFWIRKYVDKRDQQQKSGDLDFMIIRYAEVLLNYVEALTENGEWQHPDVIKYLNQVRDRAGMPDVEEAIYNSQETLRTLIRRERQAELAFEGTRYFDIRRWGIANEVMNGVVYGATNPDTDELVRVQTRVFNPNRDKLWPIPETELIANPNMVQNPNY